MVSINLILVEDEPAALNILEKIIHKLSLDLTILGKARNGLEAKKLLQNHKNIDIVISDIKMPLMDGLELAEFIYEEKIDVDVIILSGFQEFSFAQKAIEFGVEEYLLKPILPQKLEQVLSKIAAKRANNKLIKEKAVLENYLKNGHSWGGSDNDKSYKMFLLHLGSFNGLEMEYRDLIADKLLKLEKEGMFVLNGRKKSEYVFLISSNLSASEKINQIQTEFSLISYQLVYSTDVLLLEDLNGMQTKMARIVELSHKMEQHQILNLNIAKTNFLVQGDPIDWLAFKKKLEDQYFKGEWAEIEKDLQSVLSKKSELASLTTLQLVDRANHVIGFINEHLEAKVKINPRVFEDIIFSSVSLDDVIEDFQEILSHFFSQINRFPEKVDSYDFYLLIETFIHQNYAKNSLSLSLLSRHFGVSTTSINDLFKKHKKQTFKEVLMECRMSQAMLKIKNNPSQNLKRIAEEVGYKDALYFSKVFKKKYGKSPSLFQEEFLQKRLT